jgi:peptidoglycan hydrolase-like protein with peptidoglycan-binding domain
MKTAALSVGMYGPEVQLLQQQLHAWGYSVSASEVARSFYGPSTRAAVLRWQQDHKVPPTGILDARTAAGLARSGAPLTTGESVGYSEGHGQPAAAPIAKPRSGALSATVDATASGKPVSSAQAAAASPFSVTVTSPSDGVLLSTTDRRGFSVAASGTTTWPSPGPTGVGWEIDQASGGFPGSSGPAHPTSSTGNTWATWTAQILVPPGRHTLTFTAGADVRTL